MAFHFAVAAAAALSALVLAAVSLLGVVTQRWDRRLADRLVLGVLGALILSAVTGAAALVAAGPPSDPLHYLYSALALGALPVARYLGRSGSARRRAGILGAGAVLLLGFLFRLFTTGG